MRLYDRSAEEPEHDGRLSVSLRRKRLRRSRLAAALLLLASVPLGSVTFRTVRTDAVSSAAAPGLLAVLSFSRDHMLLENGNDFVWKHTVLRLNGTYLWRAELVPRSPGSIPLADFRNERGQAFDPRSMTPHSLTIEVGEAYDGKPARKDW